MSKRITSALMAFVLVLCILASAVPVFAEEPTAFRITPDKTDVHPGDTITYTVTMGPITDLAGMKFKLSIPSGLTYVEGSGKGSEGIQTTLGAARAEFVESTKVFLVGMGHYTGTETITLMTFQCSVDDGASGNLSVSFIVDPDDNIDSHDNNIACDFSNPGSTVTVTAAPKPATGISLNKTATTIYTGDTETLIAKVEPADTTDTVVWTSSKESVATVDNTGKVTAVAPGTATITAKAGSKSASCDVTVENAPCTHSLTPVAAKAETCTENGNKAYYACSVCGKWFEDAAASVEIIDHDSVILPALGHEYTEKIPDDEHKKDTAADCRSHDTYWYDCSRCNQNAKDDPAASNQWYESDNAGPHSYDESTWGYQGADGHAHKCRYDDTHDAPIAHTPGAEATETTPQTCTECGYIITPALGHTHSLTPVAAKAETCTENGNKAYYACSGCSKWFEDADGHTEITDPDSVVLPALGHDWADATCTEPKTCKRAGCGATEGTAKGHRASDEWEKNADSHWHICLDCGKKIADTEESHTPDREAPTVNDPVKCRVCGYEIAPALEAFKVELPFTVTVKLGGNLAPGKQSFELEIFDIGNSDADEYADVTVTAAVETSGEGDYTGKLIISGSEEQVKAMTSEDFYVREKDTKAANWTYSDAVWHVVFVDGQYTIYPTHAETSENGVFYVDDRAGATNAMTFVNTYTENWTVRPDKPTKPTEPPKPEDPPKQEEPTEPSEPSEPSKPAESEDPAIPQPPKTSDPSNLVLWIALLFVSGGAVTGVTLYSRKRKNVK